MKRFILGLLMIVGVTLAAAPAFAGGVLTTETLNWRFPNTQTYSSAAAFDAYQLAKKTLVASANDTTTWISTEGWLIPEQTATGADSVIIGRFIIQVDSASAYTVPSTNTLTVTVNGAAVQNDLATFNVLSTNLTPTNGTKFIVVPIWVKHGAAVLNNNATHGWVGVPPYLRLITQGTANTGAARIYVQHLKPAK